MTDINTYLKENVGKIGKNIFVAPEIPVKKLNNAAKSMGLVDNINSIIAIYDNTVFGSAEEGLAFTGEKLVFKPIFDDPIELGFSEIESVKYVKKVCINDKGKEENEEYIDVYKKNGKKIKIDALIDCEYKELATLLGKAVSDFDLFEEENQIDTLAEMSETLKVAYIKVIVNMIFSDNDRINKKEFSEILLLMMRLDLSAASCLELRSYITCKDNQIPLDVLVGQIDDACTPSHNKIVKISLVKDLINVFMSVNDGYYDEFKFLADNQTLFGVSEAEIELAIIAIKHDINMFREDIIDETLKKEMKELIAKASAIGVSIAAVYLSGSVAGLSAAGMTAGLSILGIGGALGFSNTTTSVSIAESLGVGAYKGIKQFTGTNELDKTKRRELMLNEIIKQTQSTLSLSIDYLSYITTKFNDAVVSHGLENSEVKTLMQMMTLLTGAAEILKNKSETMQNSCIKLRCPVTLDRAKLQSITTDPVKNKFYDIVMSYYEMVTVERQEDGKTIKVNVINIKKNIPTKDLEKLASIFDGIGYFRAVDVIKSKLSGIFS